ncbi:hypothetical protein ACQPYA_28000 [Micromonospora sp. CA-263727]|uniref:hypothetical protein n=1 Tax=Micromonospora sp. CA-263727 TaxID=3239967 RepID=UPI003D8FFE7C
MTGGPTNVNDSVDRLELARRIAEEMLASDRHALDIALRRPQCWSRRSVGGSAGGESAGQ